MCWFLSVFFSSFYLALLNRKISSSPSKDKSRGKRKPNFGRENASLSFVYPSLFFDSNHPSLSRLKCLCVGEKPNQVSEQADQSWRSSNCLHV